MVADTASDVTHVDARAVVLVEGASDAAAIETLAARRGRDLDAEGVAVISMGGATNIGHFVERFGPGGLDLTLAGMCDAGEERLFQTTIERAGFGTDLTRGDMENLGFFVCDRDLEDELIRCLGVAAVEQVIESQHDLASFRILQQQPAQRGWRTEDQLRRFMGTRSGRKHQYARLLVEALDLAFVPAPLDGLLATL